MLSYGSTVEYSPKAIKYLKIITKKINKLNGGLLVFDYGYTKKKNQNTLKSIKKHNYVDFFSQIGNSDITSHINFSLFNKILKKYHIDSVKITSQKNFLEKLGILNRANIISKNMTFKEKANMYYRLKKILDPKEMGSIFKVMFAQKKNGKFSLGF